MSDRKKTLLVVDDDEGMRDHLTAVLKPDYRILRVATGEAALQMMEKEDIDLMLLDVRLPGINGFEVLKITKENYPYVEVIVISVMKELDTAIEAMRHGAYHYVSKDFDLEGIGTLVRNASERQDLNRHVRVLDDLRNVARPIPMQRFPLDIKHGLGELVESMQKTAEIGGLNIETEFVLGSVYIEADMFALNRVYRNLLMNAMQATAPPRGRVIVRTFREANHAVVEIADTGCGIPPDRLNSIFEDFVTTKRRGLGLGLAILKKIVEQLGGTITVESEVSIGSTFTLRFPLTQARPSRLAAV